MNNASLELGGTNWAEKDGNILGYSVGDTSGNFSPQEFTFARGSNLSATRIDRAGLIVKGRENLLLQSNQFDTTWVSGETLTSGQIGYDGSNDAWSLISTTANSSHRIVQTFTGGSNSVVTYSLFAKSNGYDFLRIVENASTGDFATFNLSVGSVINTTGIADTAIIESVGNGWYRCSISVDGGNTTRFDIYTMETSGATDFLGDGVSGAYIQDAQAELGLAASPYIETTTTTAQAGVLENTPRLNYTTGVANPYLLLEPSRTNLLVQSEYFGGWTNDTNTSLTANAIKSPSGLVDAYKISAGTSTARQARTLSVAANGNLVFSIYAKKGEYSVVQLTDAVDGNLYANFDLENGVLGNNNNCTPSIENAGDGWYRCVIYWNATQPSINQVRISIAESKTQARLVNFAGNGTDGIYIYGAQLEEGSFPTSYIPTYSVSQTRAVDDVNELTGATSLIGQSEGTMFLDFVANDDDALQIIYQVRTTGSTNVGQIDFRIQSGNLQALGNDGGTNQFNISAGAAVAGTRYKCAVRYANNDVALYVNGVLKGTDANASFSSSSLNQIGFNENTGGFFPSVNVKQALLFKTGLTNAELATLTTI